jgi:hypothetical protein
MLSTTYIWSAPRKSDDHWIKVFSEACQIPFEFDARPAIRFILVQLNQLLKSLSGEALLLQE